jgi:hypothetical protein
MALIRSDYFIVFDSLTSDPHIAISVLRKKLPGPPGIKTVTRVHNVAEWLLSLGAEAPTYEEAKKIAERNDSYGSTIKSVYETYDHLCAWRTSQLRKEASLKEHWDMLFLVAEKMRTCIEHPTLNDLPDGRELLELREHDWRLDPTLWFYLCTPDFSQKHLWGVEFPLLESHMKDSPFWQHLEQLSQAVKMLEDDYNRIAVSLSNDDRQLREFWKSLQLEKAIRETEWGHKPSRTPHKPEPAKEEFQPYYDEEYGKEIMGIFNTAIPDLKSRQLELEKLLEQLHTDLLIDNVGGYITEGKCEKCP